MTRMTKIYAIGALIVGIVALTAYASESLKTAETPAKETAPVVVTSGGSGSCCAGGGAKQAHAQKALFTPKVQTAAKAEATCPYTGQTAAKTTNSECSAMQAAMASRAACEQTAQGAALTASKGQSCSATAKTAANEACPPGDACTQPEDCSETTAVKTAAAPAVQGACCSSEAAKTKAAAQKKAKALMAGSVPAAKTAN